MKLAIITARGGSKRIPRKNIRPFCGKPIIAYSIQTALESGCFDEVMVSTEDEEIAEISKKYGAKIPFMRSQYTASDKSTTAEVIFEVSQQYKNRNQNFDYICCLYPTAPFITTEILQESFSKLTENPNCHSVFPVARFSYPIQRALGKTNGKLYFREPEHELTFSQNLEPFFHDVGQFYWLRTKSFLESPRLVHAETFGIEIPPWQMQDIDHEEDWLLAEIKFQYLKQRKMHLSTTNA